MNPEQQQKTSDFLERCINSYAIQCFRDQADRDYIAARLAYRFELDPQFLWAAQQALEKYFKGILLLNRIVTKNIHHDLIKALKLANSLDPPLSLSAAGREFIAYINSCGVNRYIEVTYITKRDALSSLDKCVWEIRRHCQPYRAASWRPSKDEEAILDLRRRDLLTSISDGNYAFRLEGGLLEKILDDKKHPSRPALVWHNALYSLNKQRKVPINWRDSMQRPILYLFPEMLDELLKYVYIPKQLIGSYRSHLADIQANPERRP